MHTPTGSAKLAKADLQSIYDRFLGAFLCMLFQGMHLVLCYLEELSLSPLHIQDLEWQQIWYFWSTIAAFPLGFVLHTVVPDDTHDAFHDHVGLYMF